MNKRIILAAGSLAALAACGSQAGEPPVANETADIAIESSVGTATDVPRAFVDKMAASDLFEIEAGELAQEMGTSQAVKDFGAMMVRDHTDSSARLKAAATSTETSTTPPAEMPAEHRAKLEALRSAGDGFDRMYAEQQVAAHQEALATLQSQAANGTLPPLRDFAAATAPVVAEHLEMARMLP